MKKILLGISFLFSSAMHGAFLLSASYEIPEKSLMAHAGFFLDECNKGQLYHSIMQLPIDIEVAKIDTDHVNIKSSIEIPGTIISNPELVAQLGKETTLRIRKLDEITGKTQDFEVFLTITQEDRPKPEA